VSEPIFGSSVLAIELKSLYKYKVLFILFPGRRRLVSETAVTRVMLLTAVWASSQQTWVRTRPARICCLLIGNGNGDDVCRTENGKLFMVWLW